MVLGNRDLSTWGKVFIIGVLNLLIFFGLGQIRETHPLFPH